MLELSGIFLLFLLATAFVTLSGLLALAEAALLSISEPEIEEMIIQGRTGAKQLRLVNSRLTHAVAVLVILTNAVNVWGPILVSYYAVSTYGSASVGMTAGILTVATIIFSEVIPKSLGCHYAPAISRSVAPVVLMLIKLFYPLVLFLDWLPRLLKKGEREIGTEHQIRSLAAIGRRAGHIEWREGQLIQRTFLLNDVQAREIMTPLPDMVMLRATATVQEAVREVSRSEYSRYPIFGRTRNEILGMALSRDILLATVEGRQDAAVRHLLREILIVPSRTSSDALLSLFRDRRIHLAVVSESGRTIGLVTLEDVLEELVGDIDDEKDEPYFLKTPPVRKTEAEKQTEV